jgi:macrodomain Ter protein organizer (MatP/YcbG family)
MPRARKLNKPRAVPIILEHDLWEKATEEARRRGISLSEYIRQLIRRDLGLAEEERPAASL